MIRNQIARGGNEHSLYAACAVLFLAILLPLSLTAQTDSLKKVIDLKEVRIRAIKLSRRQTSSTPLQILSGEELQRLNSLTVADAVRFFSGVQLKDYGGIGGLKTINVRSMGTNHTAVFYDGVQIGNVQNGQVDLGKFSLDNIQEIELYNGQKSEIFQSAKGFASGSSLYLKSRQPDFKNGESNQYKATIKAGSYGLIDPSVFWQHKISKNVYSTVSGEWKHADGRYKFRIRNGVYDTTAVRQDGDFRSVRGEVGLNGMLPDSSKWAVKLYAYDDNQGLPGAIVNNVWRFSQRMWNRDLFVQSTYEKNIGKYSLLAAVKYSNDYQKYLNPDIVTTDGLQMNKFYQQEVYISVANRLKINSYWDVVLSSDYQYNFLDANLYLFSYPRRNTLLTALATAVHFDKVDIQANLLNTIVTDEVLRGPAQGRKNELTPTVMVSWQPFEQKEFRVRSFYKSIFRMPTFNDLYYTFYGFQILRPEYTKQYDAGFTYIKAYENQALRQFSIQSDAYFNKIKDKIVAVPNASPARWSMQNLGLVEIKGIDVNIQSEWRVSDEVGLTAGLTYTYQQALDKDKNSYTYGNQIVYIPKHSGTFLGGATYRKFSFNYSYIYTGERYNQSANILDNYVQPWYTHDLALQYNTTLHKNKMRLTAEINNLMNQDFEVVANYPMPGRNYRFSLTYDF